ncbi:MAG TPA: LON peptidase substrate-binding domain-containing protein [Caulobacteraceae bacterium]|jgi:Lon protease-like protein|nr:LON peptidase substrate-binding domain-containing protein [Caulobacteraceae bacterium]
MARTYPRKAADLPAVIPIFPLDAALLLPHGELPLNIFEPRYLNMVDDALAGERLIGMVQTTSGLGAFGPNLARVGCVGRLTSFSETVDERYLITLTGLCRFTVAEELSVRSPYRQVRADFAPFGGDLRPMADDDGFDRLRFLAALKAYLDRRGLAMEDWESPKSAAAESLVNGLAMVLPFSPSEKQALLEAPSLSERREALIALMEIDAAPGPREDEPPLLN